MRCTLLGTPPRPTSLAIAAPEAAYNVLERMSYRDDQEALRARLDATEERLRIAEEELADANRRADAPRSAPARSRRVESPSRARRQRPFRSELDAFAYGRHWEFVSAGLSLIINATLFRLDAISGALAVALFLSSVAGVALLSRWMRSAPQRLARALEDLENDPATVADVNPQARTRVGIDPAGIRNDLAEEDVSAETLEEGCELPSARKSENR